MSIECPKIVIVGGGSGGLELATRLGNTLGKKAKASIHLVDKNMTHIWKPLYHELAAGTFNLYTDEINYLHHAQNHHYQFHLGKIYKLDREHKQIHLSSTLDKHKNIIIQKQHLDYDILVIAIGSISNDFNIPGVKKYCFFLDDQKQAKYFHHLFLNLILKINFDQQAKKQLFRIGIVGGGATGVELAAELEYALSESIFYHKRNEFLSKQIEITIIESGKRIVPHLPEHLIQLTEAELARRKIKILTEHKVVRVEKEGFYIHNGFFIPAQIKIWAAGIIAPAILKNLDGLETNYLNQLLVKPTLQTTRDPSIFALGDCSCCYQNDTGVTVPPRAQAAHQEAARLAENIQRFLAEKPLKNFHYINYGDLLTLSKKDSFGYLMGSFMNKITLKGKLARFAYWILYKRHQICIQGIWATFIAILTGFLNHRKKPYVKLH